MRHRVLIADDEEDARIGLASLVSTWGYEVAEAVDGKRLGVLLEKVVERVEVLREVTLLRRQLRESRGFGPLLGISPSMQEVYQFIELAATSSAPVLVTGETGTGKELVARTIHQMSSRAKGP